MKESRHWSIHPAWGQSRNLETEIVINLCRRNQERLWKDMKGPLHFMNFFSGYRQWLHCCVHFMHVHQAEWMIIHFYVGIVINSLLFITPVNSVCHLILLLYAQEKIFCLESVVCFPNTNELSIYHLQTWVLMSHWG